MSNALQQTHMQGPPYSQTQLVRDASVSVIALSTLEPSNDAGQRVFHQQDVGKKLLIIFAMVVSIACFVWLLG